MRKRITQPAANASSYLKGRWAQLLLNTTKRLLHIRLIGLYTAIFAAIYFYPVFQAAYASIQEKVSNFLITHHLVVSDIYLEGQKYSSEDDIVQALAINVNGSILQMDLDAIKERLEKLPWVSHASIERQLPSTIAVHILERTPMFLWQKDGKLKIVDSTGHLIEDNDTTRFSDLIILIGDDAPNFAPSLLSIVSQDDDIFPLISSMTRISGRRWNIRLYNNIQIKLPEENISEAWNVLSKMNKENKHLFHGIQMIDLRLAPEKIFIK